MEIERKFLVEEKNLPNLSEYPSHRMEQGYLCVDPVVRIRRSDEDYYLTYKSRGLLSREEYNLPLTKEGYEHMREKVDGILIRKTRYLIPEKDGYTLIADVENAADMIGVARVTKTENAEETETAEAETEGVSEEEAVESVTES
ncbi:MAG: CYTH domain-containing protein, partial [Blautia sp.]|nr:CYTH domain-containing protein [Blautia sp.]